MALKLAMARNAARNASAISPCTTASRTGDKSASADGPVCTKRANSRAACRVCRGQHTEQAPFPTTAAPNAAPMERENCTDAAAAPSCLGPATSCTVSCTTGIAVPWVNAIAPNSQGSSRQRQLRREHARPDQNATTRQPERGNTAVRPVLLIIRPVNTDPTAMNAVSGNRSRPVLHRRGPAHDLQVDRQRRSSATPGGADAGRHRVGPPDRRSAAGAGSATAAAPTASPAAAASASAADRYPVTSDQRQQRARRTAAPAPAPAGHGVMNSANSPTPDEVEVQPPAPGRPIRQPERQHQRQQPRAAG